MKSIDECLRESIDNYKNLTAKIMELGDRMEILEPCEIQKQCASIRELQEVVVEHEEKLCQIMTFIGEKSLENPLVGEYQRALDTAIKEAAVIDSKARLRKDQLLEELSQKEMFNKDDSCDPTVESCSDSLLQ